jgi:hypothetical protein
MPQAGYVYIVHGKGTSYIKIGKTTSIIARLQELGQGVPFDLQLISLDTLMKRLSQSFGVTSPPKGWDRLGKISFWRKKFWHFYRKRATSTW